MLDWSGDEVTVVTIVVTRLTVVLVEGRVGDCGDSDDSGDRVVANFHSYEWTSQFVRYKRKQENMQLEKRSAF